MLLVEDHRVETKVTNQTISTNFGGRFSGVKAMVLSKCEKYLYSGMSNGNIYKICLKNQEIESNPKCLQ